MFRRFSINYAILSITLDIWLTLLALHLAVILRPSLPSFPFIVPVTDIQLPAFLYFIVPVIWTAVFLLASAYDPRRNYRVVDEFQTLTLAVAFASLVFAGVLYVGFRNVSRYLFLVFVVFDVAFLLGWRTLARFSFRVYGNSPAERRAIIVGAGQMGRQVSEMMQNYASMGLNLVGYLDDEAHRNQGTRYFHGLPVLGGLRDVRDVVRHQKVDDVVLAMPQQAYEEISRLVWELQDLPVHVRVVPDYFSLALYRASAEEFAGVPMINLRDPALNDVQRMTKRCVDLVLGLGLLLLVSPLMMLTAGLIRLDSPGPILFRQQRVGENGRIFGMFKFRSMVPDAEKRLNEVRRVDGNGNVVFKAKNDPRITRIGRFIRRTSLDELPQLFNVLKGDMSLVGPRPEMPWLVQDYEPWQLKRFAVPQGITGWWQVNGRSDKPMHLHTEEDIYYVQNYSLWMDIYILLKTPWVVLRGKGAY